MNIEGVRKSIEIREVSETKNEGMKDPKLEKRIMEIDRISSLVTASMD